MKFLLFLLLAGPVLGVPLDRLRQELIRWEGYHLAPYRDGPGYSVGIGHSLTAHRMPLRYYSSAEIERFLCEDVSWSLDACRKGIRGFDALPDEVQIVCISVAFGVGRTGFARFYSFREALSRRAYHVAANELRNSKWARQVGPTRMKHHINTLLAYF